MIFRIAFWILIFFLFLHPINSGDLYHHLNTGRFVLSHWRLPVSDEWSFTAYGKPWVAHSWGSGVVFYLLYTGFGPGSIRVICALIGLSTAFLIFRMIRNRGANMWLGLSLTFMASAVISLRWLTRPEIMAPFFLILLLTLLEREKREGRMVWSVPILFFAWGIFYGATVILGLAILLFFVIVEKAIRRHALWLVPLSLLGAMANGYGWKSLFYAFIIPGEFAYNSEWQSLWWYLTLPFPEVAFLYQFPAVGYLLFLAAFILAVFCLLGQKRHNAFGVPLILSLAVFLPIVRLRLLSLAPVLAVPLFARTVVCTTRRKGFLTLFSAIVGMLATLGSVYTQGIGWGESEQFESNLVAFFNDRHLSGNLFVTQELAAYFSFKMPTLAVFVDTRDDLFLDTRVFTDLMRLGSVGYDIQSLVEDYPIDVVVATVAEGKLYEPLLYDSRWSLVFLTDGFFVLVRTHQADQLGLSTYNGIDPLRIPPTKPGKLPEATRQLEELSRQDSSQYTALQYAQVLAATGRVEEASKVRSTIAAPSVFSVRGLIDRIAYENELGRFHLDRKDCGESGTHLFFADRLNRGKLLFAPQTALVPEVDRSLVEYYAVCRGNT